MDQRAMNDIPERQMNALRMENETLRKNLAEIQASEAFHRITLENISDTVIITDDHGNIIYACPNVNVIFGLSYHQVYEKGSIQKLIDGTVCDFSELRKAGEIPNIEWKIQNSSGQERFVLITVKSVSLKDGTVLYVMRDITDRKQADIESLKNTYRFRQLFENAGYYAYFVSPGGTIIDANNAALDILEYTKEELIGKHLSFIYAEESREEAERLFEAWKSIGNIRNAELMITSKSGCNRWVLLNANSVRDDAGRVVHSASIQVDITEKKAKEKELTKKQDELKKYTHKLEEMNTALKVLIDYRREEVEDVKRSIIAKFKKIVIPYLPTAPETKTREELLTAFSILGNNIKEILFGNRNHAEEFSGLSPTESRLASMIKSGKSSTEIAASLNMSLRTVYFHRENLRKKLNLSRTKTNLKAYLQSSGT